MGWLKEARFTLYDKFITIILLIFGLAYLIDQTAHVIEDGKEAAHKEQMLLEPDPLTVTSTDSSPQTVGCGGVILIPRHITTTKPLFNVKVIRQLFFFNGVHHTRLPDLGTVEYSEIKAIDKDDIYRIKLPDTLLDGDYLYSPVLSYKVNEYLTITKQSPTQFFTIDCEITK